jgi:hypothetical protein
VFYSDLFKAITSNDHISIIVCESLLAKKQKRLISQIENVKTYFVASKENNSLSLVVQVKSAGRTIVFRVNINLPNHIS